MWIEIACACALLYGLVKGWINGLFQELVSAGGFLIGLGFQKEGHSYVISVPLNEKGFVLSVTVNEEGEVDAKVSEDEEEFEGYRRQILGEYSALIKEEVVSFLTKVKNEAFVALLPIHYYLLPSNPKIYDVEKGFAQYGGYLDWPARKKMKEGDVVFIYSAKPFGGLAFRCHVTAVDEAGEGYGSNVTYNTILCLDETYEKGAFPLNELLVHGLRTVRFLHQVSPELASFVMKGPKARK